jgi:hypothetical protein
MRGYQGLYMSTNGMSERRGNTLRRRTKKHDDG